MLTTAQRNKLQADAKFAELLPKAWQLIYNSVVNKNEPVLGNASDDGTIMDFLEGRLSEEDYDYIMHNKHFNYDLFCETIFSLYAQFNLYAYDTMYK